MSGAGQVSGKLVVGGGRAAPAYVRPAGRFDPHAIGCPKSRCAHWAVVYPRLSTQSLKPSAAYGPRDLNDPVTTAPRLSNRAAILDNIPPTAVL